MSQPRRQPSRWGHIDPSYAVNTWRYLRLAMFVLVLGLAASVLYERAHARCFEPSISAYYYTPARGYFVCALVGIAVCLVCLRGNTPVEDLLLNLAGMFAPVVAFVPTPNAGTCTSVKSAAENRGANIANNVTALLVVGAVALIIVAFVFLRERPTRAARIAAAVAAGFWLATLLVFELARPFLDRHGHDVAAGLMFGCITIVALITGVEYKRSKGRRTLLNRYMAVAAGMVMAIVYFIAGKALGASHATLVSETALIFLFAVFWGFQTFALWTPGLPAPRQR